MIFLRKFAKRLVTAVNCCLLALLVLTIYMQKQLPDRYSVVAGEEITFPPGDPIQMVRPTASGGVQAAQSSAGDSYHLDLKLLGTIPVKTVEVNVVERKLVTVSGAPFGIKMFTDGLMVVGMSDIPTAEGRVNPAKDAGLEVGVYFFSQAVNTWEAEEEADYILSAIEGYDIAYPVAFDWEPISPGNNARTDGLDNQVLTQCAAAFCEKIRDAGYRPAVYFNQSLGYLRYDLRELTDYILWLAEYDTKPDFYYCFDLWQYTHTGQVAGIEGDVDLDLDLRLG